MNDAQKAAAEKALKDAGKELGQPVAVKLGGNASFFPAEDYHQNYYLGSNRVLTRFGYVRQSDAYAGYRDGCGRDARVKALWGGAAYSYPVTVGSGS